MGKYEVSVPEKCNVKINFEKITGKIEDKRKKQVCNLSKFIFYPHWFLILFFFLFSSFDFGIYSLINLIGYLITFISSFGLGLRLNFSYIKDFDFEEVKTLFILMISFFIGFIKQTIRIFIPL